MSTSPEIKIDSQPQGLPVEHIPESYQETPTEAAEGVVGTPATPTVPVVQIPSGQTIQPVPAPAAGPSIQLPADPAVLQQQSKGSTSDAATWSAVFWLRMMKKALLKQIRILVGGGNA